MGFFPGGGAWQRLLADASPLCVQHLPRPPRWGALIGAETPSEVGLCRPPARPPAYPEARQPHRGLTTQALRPPGPIAWTHPARSPRDDGSERAAAKLRPAVLTPGRGHREAAPGRGRDEDQPPGSPWWTACAARRRLHSPGLRLAHRAFGGGG